MNLNEIYNGYKMYKHSHKALTFHFETDTLKTIAKSKNLQHQNSVHFERVHIYFLGRTNNFLMNLDPLVISKL